MNNISFKGFYQVEPIGNKKVNMKLVSEMVKTIPGTEAIESSNYNTKTYFVPEEEENQFERLAEALMAKALANIKSMDINKRTIDTLIRTKIRDFNPSNDHAYVAISSDFLRKALSKRQNKGTQNLFDFISQNTKIDVPELTVIKSSKDKNSSLTFDIQFTNNTQQTVYSLLKLGYNEIPVKLAKRDLRELERQSTKLNQNIITRHIDILPLKK